MYSKSDLSNLPIIILSLNDIRNRFLEFHFLKNDVKGMNNEVINISSLSYSNLFTVLTGCLSFVTPSRYRRVRNFDDLFLKCSFVVSDPILMSNKDLVSLRGTKFFQLVS